MKRIQKALIAIITGTLLLMSSVTMAFAAEGVAGLEDIAAFGSGVLTDINKVLKTDFTVKANEKAGLDGTVTVMLDLESASGILYLPGSADTSKLRLSWEDEELIVSKGSKEYTSGKAPVAADGKKAKYQLSKNGAVSYLTIKTIKGSSKVKPMFIDVDETKGSIKAMNSDKNHDTECYGSVKYKEIQKKIKIKGRGNTTWELPKKPYSISFYNKDYSDKKKVELIDGVKTKKWYLLANYLDSSMMRNKIALDLADNLGIGLKSEFVDVWMNGSYCGNYQLTPKKDINCPDEGYIIENDHLEDTESKDQFKINYMKEIPGTDKYINVLEIGEVAEQKGVTAKSIKTYMDEAWAAVLDMDSEDYQNYFDMDSWAKQYLMLEVSKTYSCFAGNLIMHRDGTSKKDKLIAGPAWDYDIAFGRTLHKPQVAVSEPMQVNAEGWYNDSIGYLYESEPVTMLQGLGMHKSFMKHVAKVYNDYKWAFEDLENDVEVQRSILRKSVQMNNTKLDAYPISTDFVIAPNTMRAIGSGKYKLDYKVTLTWDDYVDNLKEYCNKRVLWMSDHMAPGETIKTFHGGTVHV